MASGTGQTRDAVETRQRILDAAAACFSHAIFERVTVRDIAGVAKVDAALINRYFASKRMLFAEVAEGAIQLGEALPQTLDTLGDLLVESVMGDAGSNTGGFHPLRFLILGLASSATSASVTVQFQTEFVEALASRLMGRDADLRATMIASYVIGLATMRHFVVSPVLANATQKQLAALVGEAIQRCVRTPGEES